MSRGDEFFVGYAPRMPPGTGRTIRVTSLVLVGAALVVAAGLATVQRPPAPARFEYGLVRPFDGVVLERPVPMLLVTGPGGSTTGYLLVDEGKHGARLDNLHGRPARLEGTLIQRGRRTMVELHGPADIAGPPAPVPQASPPDELVLAGEIVDAKCHLGAMNPGDGLTHRACALRCLSGGIPALLVVPGSAGPEQIILAPEPGSALPRPVRDLAGLPVRARGLVDSVAGWRVLRVSSATFSREGW